MNRSTDQLFDSRIADWLEEDPNRAPNQALETILAAVPSISQRRTLRTPWRFPMMTPLVRAISVAAVAIVAVLGAGAVLILNLPGGPGARVTPTPTTTQTMPPGIIGWTPYTSAVHGYTMAYPENWSVHAPASRTWKPGDAFPGDLWPFADSFVSPGDGDESIGLFVWEMPVEDGVDVESVQGLKAWAQTYCEDVGASSCQEFAQGAVPMCLNAGGDPCRGALLVPTTGQQYAFFVDWGSAILSDPRVRVVVVGREDSHPSAATYGGSVELLKSILTTMDVWTPGQRPPS